MLIPGTLKLLKHCRLCFLYYEVSYLIEIYFITKINTATLHNFF